LLVFRAFLVSNSRLIPSSSASTIGNPHSCVLPSSREDLQDILSDTIRRNCMRCWRAKKGPSAFLFMHGYSDAAEAVILTPAEDTAHFCVLNEFKAEQSLQINEMITARPDPQYYSMSTLGIGCFRSIARELKL